MDPSYVWFRFTQVAMKVTLILGLVVWSALVPARPPFSMSGRWDASGFRFDH